MDFMHDELAAAVSASSVAGVQAAAGKSRSCAYSVSWKGRKEKSSWKIHPGGPLVVLWAQGHSEHHWGHQHKPEGHHFPPKGAED